MLELIKHPLIQRLRQQSANNANLNVILASVGFSLEVVRTEKGKDLSWDYSVNNTFFSKKKFTDPKLCYAAMYRTVAEIIAGKLNTPKRGYVWR